MRILRRPVSGKATLMFRNVRFYNLNDDWPESEELLSQTLESAAFSPCGPLTERSNGWVPDKFPNETERIHEENPILQSEKAQRLKAILCKTLKSEIRGTLKSSYDFQVFWETAITSVTQEEDEWRRKMNGGWNEEDS
jgi:hypothetical protein